MRMNLFAVFFAAFVFLFPRTGQAETIGTVVEIEGTATISRSGGTPFALALNDRLETGDVVATAAKSRLFILLADNTEWTLSENTRFRVDEYLFDSEDSSENKARYSAAGGFRYVSGLVAKKQNPDVTISSTAGTIGIRGTDITVAPDADGSYDVYVDDGTIDVASGGANARLQRGQGTMIAKRGAPPMAPKDWKPARLDRMRGALQLARGAEVRDRIRNMQPQQMEMRGKLREKIMERRERIKENKEGRREDRKDRTQQWKEQFGHGQDGNAQPGNGQMKEQLREKIQQRQDGQGLQPMNGQQPRNGQIKEQLREKIQQRQDGQGLQPMNGQQPRNGQIKDQLREKMQQWQDRQGLQPMNAQPRNGQIKEQLREKIRQRQDGQGMQPMNGQQPRNGQIKGQLREKMQQRQDGQNPQPVNPTPQNGKPVPPRPPVNKIRQPQ